MIHILLLVLLCIPAICNAVIETYEFDNSQLEKRYFDLSAELRCPKCQNQNIADSNAPIAADLRKQLHQQLHAGRSDAEIAEYMVQRYGEFVLYRPRWSASTALLWLAPALFLLLAAIGLASTLRSSRSAGADEPDVDELPAEERQRLQSLLNESDADTPGVDRNA